MKKRIKTRRLTDIYHSDDDDVGYGYNHALLYKTTGLWVPKLYCTYLPFRYFYQAHALMPKAANSCSLTRPHMEYGIQVS